MERAEVGEAGAATDSTGMRTDRHGDKAKPYKKTGKESVARTKPHSKWRVFAVVKLQIVLPCAPTPGSAAGTSMLRPLLEKSKKPGAVSPACGSAPTGGTTRTPTARPSRACTPTSSRERAGRTAATGATPASGSGARPKPGSIMSGTSGARWPGAYSEPRKRAAAGCTAGTGKEAQERFGMLLAVTWNVRALNRIRCVQEAAVMPAAAQGRPGLEERAPYLAAKL